MLDYAVLQFEIIRRVLGRNLEGVTDEQSLRRPTPAGNCLNWIVGHLVASYDRLLPVLGQEPVWGEAEHRLYQRGSEALTDGSPALPLSAIREAYETAHGRLLAGLSALPAERLADPAPFSPGGNPDETVGTLVYGFAFHQAYHLGQTGLARRLLGLPGAIA